MTTVKTMPHSEKLEESIICLLMTYDDIAHDIIHSLSEDAFYISSNRIIYIKCVDIIKRGLSCDLVTLSKELAGKVDILSLSKIANVYVNDDLTSQYIDDILELQKRRELIHVSLETNKAYSQDYDVDELIGNVSNKLDTIGVTEDESSKMFVDIFKECMDQHQYSIDNGGKTDGISSGYRGLNRLNGGWSDGELIILAGRPSMGKTTLALNFMLDALHNNKKVAMYSMEMTTKELGQKMMSVMTGIETDRIKLGQCSPDELNRLNEVFSPIINNDCLMVDDNGGMDIHKLKSSAKRMKATKGLDLIVIDYLQLLKGVDKEVKGGSREQQISYLSRSLKALAKDLDIPIICLSQLSRALESREDKRPMLSDLRESGAIEQDANQVIFVYREGYYTKDDSNNLTEVIIGKNRSGRTGTCELVFDGSKSTFVEHTEESFINQANKSNG
tara:strand:+ start:2541 stop:3878 length:1338 start_codon:yes stop_codon:yes gene_type:complete